MFGWVDILTFLTFYLNYLDPYRAISTFPFARSELTFNICYSSFVSKFCEPLLTGNIKTCEGQQIYVHEHK